jgi:hypothetical protein
MKTRYLLFEERRFKTVPEITKGTCEGCSLFKTVKAGGCHYSYSCYNSQSIYIEDKLYNMLRGCLDKEED